MLTHLHVKNLALISEAEVDFTKGLNILTGETGAGKSILVGSVALALGGKASKDLVRSGAPYGLAELVFEVENEGHSQKLLEMGVVPDEEGSVVISRKITDGRSVNKINGETVTLTALKDAAALLVDLHGQHENQSLLDKRKHLEILDGFAGAELSEIKAELKESCRSYRRLTSEYEKASAAGETREHEIKRLEAETAEIEAASLQIGEDEELETLYNRMANAMNLREAAGAAHALTGYEGESAGSLIGRAVRELGAAVSYDDSVSGLVGELSDVDDLLNDFNRDLSDYLASLEFDDAEFAKTGERLNLINTLKDKYGFTIEDILDGLSKKKEMLSKLYDYDGCLEELRTKAAHEKERLEGLCAKASVIRKKYAGKLEEAMRVHLADLNFLNCEFKISFETLYDFTPEGTDGVEFLISANPGEPLRPLSRTASGGELSRIMLALKTVTADMDETEAVIFDEIDAGISGRTAQKVAEKLMLISRQRQVICITHLAQIAAMADSHYRIEKTSDGGSTWTSVERLGRNECIEELSRMLGGAQITGAVLENAAEMKELADQGKKSL